MREATVDLWSVPAEIICITTNGFIKKNGEGVMGRGTAAQAAHLYPELPRALGQNLQAYGNHVSILRPSIKNHETMLVSFPVKHNWWEEADLNLIEQSADELVEYMNEGWGNGWPTDEPNITCAIPRPGCGNGGLKWEVVKPVLEPLFDDRFLVVSLA